MRWIARARRAATLAISLPSVVGLAGWPWVRDSIGCVALSLASSTRRACTRLSAGTMTPSRAPLSIMPCEVLLMSSEVQAKWMNSLAASSSALPLTCSLSQYSTAFTSWLVTASISLMRPASASENLSTSASSAASEAAENFGMSGRPAWASAISQCTSTLTRLRMKAASDSHSRSASALAA
ncbi:hypothetical protein D9M72_342160 [compost metagenome]